MSNQISAVQMNRFLLRQQGLLAREGGDPVSMACRLCGLHAQVASTPHLSLWARLQAVRPADVERALYDDRTLVRMWLMRGTAHVVPTADLPIYLGALRNPATERWPSSLRRRGIGPDDIPWDRLASAARSALQGGPLLRSALEEALGREVTLPDGLPWQGIIYTLCKRGLLVAARPTGAWYYYGRAALAWREDWTGLTDEEILPEGEARGRLFLRYLKAFGPASVNDFAYWAGLKVGQARTALASVRHRVSRVDVQGSSRTHWVCENDLARLLAVDPEEPVPPRMLPRFDTLLLGHEEKGHLLDEADRTSIFRPQADVVAPLLIDGRVAGTWNYRLSKSRLEVSHEPFTPLPAEVSSVLEEETAALRRYCRQE